MMKVTILENETHAEDGEGRIYEILGVQASLKGEVYPIGSRFANVVLCKGTIHTAGFLHEQSEEVSTNKIIIR